jgi:ABC-type transport system involved in cytochrome c biogenesis permease subunit
MNRFTRALPWILVVAFAAWVLSALRPPKEPGFKLSEFGKLPVLLEGRVQPLDSVARNTLLQIRTKTTVLLDDGRTSMPAIEWLAEAMIKPEVADTRKIFRIDPATMRGSGPEMLALLKLPEKQKYFSLNDIKPAIGELQKQTDRIVKIDEKLRTPFEQQVMKVANALMLYNRVKNSLKHETTTDFAKELEGYGKSIQPGVAAVRAQQSGQEYNKEAFDDILEYLSRYDFMSRFSYPMLIPPAHPETDRDHWQNVGASLMAVVKGGEIHPAATHYAALSSAYAGGDAPEFNRHLADYQSWLKSKHLNVEITKARKEFLFNKLELFYHATVIYLLAFLAGCLSWFKMSPTLRRSGLALACFAFAVHTVGLLFRMHLEGRPPVTNLYSSAIFVGWGAVLLALILEKFYRDAVGIVTASVVGFATQVIAHNLALGGGDTMIMLRAVLDTNFWLSTHVVIIALGYASMFVAGFLAILYIIRGVFTTTLSGAVGKSLQQMVYGIMCFATFFSFVGTILGGIWADQSWGRFWGWDPKENGALLIVLWAATWLHTRWGGLLKERGLMCMAVFSNIVTSFSWFGVNMLGIGLHSYGFMDAAFKWLMGFVASQLLLIALGMLPRQYWRSFRSPPGPNIGNDPTAVLTEVKA